MSEIFDIQKGVDGFAEEMRQRNIHVGMGRDPVCVNCGLSWPCPGSKEPHEPL